MKTFSKLISKRPSSAKKVHPSALFAETDYYLEKNLNHFAMLQKTFVILLSGTVTNFEVTNFEIVD